MGGERTAMAATPQAYGVFAYALRLQTNKKKRANGVGIHMSMPKAKAEDKRTSAKRTVRCKGCGCKLIRTECLGCKIETERIAKKLESKGNK